jgi:hypothetical protein
LALGALGATTSCRVGYEALPNDLLDTGAVGSGAFATSAGSDGVIGGADSGPTSAQGGGPDEGMGAQPAQGGAGAEGGAIPDSGGEGGSMSGGSGGTGAARTCRTATFSGHAYEHCDAPVTFADAAADCGARGLRLVKIETEDEQIWVHSMIPAADQSNNSTKLWRWIGGDDQVTVGDWRWSDGEAFWSGGNQGSAVDDAYTNWNRNQPLNNAFCLAMEARSGTWYAMDCDAPRPYVCELY